MVEVYSIYDVCTVCITVHVIMQRRGKWRFYIALTQIANCHQPLTAPKSQSTSTLLAEGMLRSTSSSSTRYGRGNISVCRHGSRGSILIVALNRPAVKNAFSDDLYLDLIDVMAEVAADSSLTVLVMTGTGSYFSSGADLKGTSMLNDDGTDRDTLSIPPGRFMMSMITFPKILCAAVNGPAIGIGVTLLLHCDLCYCSETATLWAPFTRLALGEID